MSNSINELYSGNGPDGLLRPTVDIIAVHGLNPSNNANHATATWEHPKSGHLWLRDALPQEQPTVRTLLYSYNSSPVFGADKEHFVHQANSLLELLRLTRRKDPMRPLIMIGHSLGGILIKQALVNAQNNPKYTDIKSATFALVFFGTPHSGPTNDLKVKFGKACAAIAQSMPWHVSNDILEALKKGSQFSDLLSEHWRHQLESYRIISFYEGYGSLVSRESAVLGLAGLREQQLELKAMHSDMCRFDLTNEKDQNNYFVVQGNIAELCEQYSVDSVNIQDYKDLIESLRSLSFNPRLGKISEKHQESLQWIWKERDSGPGFVKWAESNDPIYWITGLSGSGKSTMMKYLYEDRMLETLTKHQSVIKAGYFFHELGEPHEKTFTGFLASVLEQFLTSLGGLAPQPLKLFKDLKRKASRQFRGSLWDESTLKQALKSIGSRQSGAGSVAMLVVDGLDECSGDHRKQLDFLIPWVQSTQGSGFQVRMCLASRPLQEIHFRLSTYPECMIHKWTEKDISQYVHDRLNRTWNDLDPGRQRLYRFTSDAYLIERVVQKAQGVFLWVKIVVDNLVIGLEEGSTDTELVETLDSLPGELETLYHSLISQIPDHYIHEAKRYLQLIFSRRALGLLEFYLATRDPAEVFAKNAESSREDHLKVRDACLLMETRIRSRCRGLLQVTQITKDRRDLRVDNKPELSDDAGILVPVLVKKVEFLHLSIRECLESADFVRSSDSPEEMEAFMAASVGLLKLVPPIQLFRGLDKILNADLKQVADADAVVRSDDEWIEPPSFQDWSPLGEYTLDTYMGDLTTVGYRPIEEFLRFAWLPKRRPNSYGRRLLLELDRICTLADQNWCSRYLKCAVWAEGFDSATFVSNEGFVDNDPGSWNADLFCVCLSHGLDTYVKEELEHAMYKPIQRTGRPLLRFVFDRCVFNSEIPNPKTLQILLEHGAQPMEEYAGQTNWECAIKSVIHATVDCSIEQDDWASVLLLLVEYGADPNQPFSITVDRGTRGLAFEEILDVMCRQKTWRFDARMKLLQTLVEHGARPFDYQLSTLPGSIAKAIRKAIAGLEGPQTSSPPAQVASDSSSDS